jgi:hypothetical protein
MDALAALGLATIGAVAVGLGLRAHWLSGLAATYLAHTWFVAIPLVWLFGLSRRFPTGMRQVGLEKLGRPPPDDERFRRLVAEEVFIRLRRQYRTDFLPGLAA